MEQTIFIKRTDSDELVPVTGSIEEFYSSVVQPRKEIDMNFALRTLQDFLKPSSTKPLRSGCQT